MLKSQWWRSHSQETRGRDGPAQLWRMFAGRADAHINASPHPVGHILTNRRNRLLCPRADYDNWLHLGAFRLRRKAQLGKVHLAVYGKPTQSKPQRITRHIQRQIPASLHLTQWLTRYAYPPLARCSTPATLSIFFRLEIRRLYPRTPQRHIPKICFLRRLEKRQNPHFGRVPQDTRLLYLPNQRPLSIPLIYVFLRKWVTLQYKNRKVKFEHVQKDC